MKFMSFLLVVMMLFVGCESPTEPPVDPPVDPPVEWEAPVIQLTQIDASLGKQLVDSGDMFQVDKQWYLKKEAIAEVASLMKPVSSFINFSEFTATTTYFYMLVNNYSTDINDVVFSADSVVVKPGNIVVIEGTTGAGIGAIPILSVTAPHVLPVNRSGSLLPFEIGELTDSVLVDYSYTNPNGDTLNTTQGWSVSGTKMGGMFDLYVDSLDIFGNILADFNLSENYANGENVAVVNADVENPNSAEVMLVNTGNVTLFVDVYSNNDHNIVTTDPIGVFEVLVGDSLDLSEYNNGGGAINLFRVSTESAMMKVYNRVIQEGVCQFIPFLF